jgi:hypothetical protein
LRCRAVVAFRYRRAVDAAGDYVHEKTPLRSVFPLTSIAPTPLRSVFPLTSIVPTPLDVLFKLTSLDVPFKLTSLDVPFKLTPFVDAKPIYYLFPIIFYLSILYSLQKKRSILLAESAPQSTN